MSISAKFQSDWTWSDQWIWFSLIVRKVWNVAYTSFDFLWGWRWSNWDILTSPFDSASSNEYFCIVLIWLDMIWPMNLIFTVGQEVNILWEITFWILLRTKMTELRHSNIASRLSMLEWVFLQSFDLIGHDLTNESDFHCRWKGQHY